MALADQLTEGQLAGCALELRGKAAVIMTTEQVRNMLRGRKQESFCRRLLRDYPDATGKHGLDTYERDILFDIFAERIAGVDHWPMFIDDEAYGESFVEGIRKAFKAGKIDIEQEPNADAA